MFDEEQDVVGDEFMAIKPWIGAIKAPSDFRKPMKNHNQAPPV
jgi:WD40 repeat protein